MDWNVITSNLPLLLYGALMTIKITAVAVSCGFIIGLIVSLARMSNFVIIRLIAKCYVDVIRGTPMLVQIFMIYFALPQIIGTRIDPYVAACAACSINSGAYVSEIFRAGIQSVDKGQMEAGRALGLSYSQTMRKIIVPQAIKNILPALVSEFIALLKETSIIGFIGGIDLLRSASIITSQTYRGVEPLLAVGIIYLILTSIFTAFMRKVERGLKVSD